MAQGKQAKILTVKQEAFILHHLSTTRYPRWDRVMLLFSMKAGRRAKEIAAVTWAMVTDAEGAVGEALHLVNTATKDRIPVAVRQVRSFLRAHRPAMA